MNDQIPVLMAYEFLDAAIWITFSPAGMFTKWGTNNSSKPVLYTLF